jgi:hypothetical protein
VYNLNRTRLFSPSSPGESYLFCVDVKEGSSLRCILDLAVLTHHVDAGWCVVDSIHSSAAVEVIRYPIVCLLGRAPAHEELARWCEEQGGWGLAVVERHNEAQGFEVLPKRWIVARTFGWLCRDRRLAKDYERKVQTSEALIEVATIRLMLRRLARAA